MLKKFISSIIVLFMCGCTVSKTAPTVTPLASDLPTEVQGKGVNVAKEDVFLELLRQVNLLCDNQFVMHVEYKNELDNFKIISDASLTKDDVIENKLTNVQNDAILAYQQALVDFNKTIVTLLNDNDFEIVDALTSNANPLIKIDHIKHHSLEYTLTLYEDGFVECTSDTSTQYLRSETVVSDDTLESIKDALENLPLTLTITVSNTEKESEGCNHGYTFGEDIKFTHIAKYTYTDNQGNSFVSEVKDETFYIQCIGHN